MVELKESISLKQSLLMFIVLIISPAVRYIPTGAITEAKQAAWVSPVVSLLIGLAFIAIWCKILKKYDKESFVTITQDILGKKLGTIISMVYLIWITLLIAYYARMYSERLTSTVMPHVNILVFISLMLLIVAYVLRGGIVTLSRMNELISVFIIGTLIATVVLIIPEMNFENLFPLTHKDIIPVFKASTTTVSLLSYLTILFMFGDKIDSKRDMRKLGTKTIILLTAISLITICIPLLVFGWSISLKMPIPYFSSIMQISLFDTLERLESLITILWIMTDFILISAFTYAAMHIIEMIFKTSKTKPVKNIYILGVFFLSLILCNSLFDLLNFSRYILTPMNLVIGCISPVIILIIGKIRKKL